VETVARHNRVQVLYGLLDSRKGDPDVWEGTPLGPRLRPRAAGSSELLQEKFAALGFVKYHIQMPGQMNTQLIEAAVRAGRGCVVGITLPARGGAPKRKHAVVAIELTQTEFRYIDPDDATRENSVPRRLFDAHWDGFVVTLDP
jgi:hypothetical protein